MKMEYPGAKLELTDGVMDGAEEGNGVGGDWARLWCMITVSMNE